MLQYTWACKTILYKFKEATFLFKRCLLDTVICTKKHLVTALPNSMKPLLQMHQFLIMLTGFLIDAYTGNYHVISKTDV
jgi:hypothetical protein